MSEHGPRYVVQYRDASNFTWEALDDEGYDWPGEALTARDRLLDEEPNYLPRGRHRAVDVETGTILEWRTQEVDG